MDATPYTQIPDWLSAILASLTLGAGCVALGWKAKSWLRPDSVTLTEAHTQALAAAAQLALSHEERLKESDQHIADIRALSQQFASEATATRGILTAIAARIEHNQELARERQSMALNWHEDNLREQEHLGNAVRDLSRNLERASYPAGRCTAPCCTPTAERR